jgi:hypothetical protein
MATTLEIIRGLAQAAANAYDGAHLDNEIGLKREEGNPLIDSRVIDGFAVKCAGDKLVINYQSEMQVKELHPRNRFENEIEEKFKDIAKFLKKEYKKITKESITLKPQEGVDILVQATSKYRTWVQASKQYSIGGLEKDGTEAIRTDSQNHRDDPYYSQFKDFWKTASAKKSSNDKAKKNPDTPEA